MEAFGFNIIIGLYKTSTASRDNMQSIVLLVWLLSAVRNWRT